MGDLHLVSSLAKHSPVMQITNMVSAAELSYFNIPEKYEYINLGPNSMRKFRCSPAGLVIESHSAHVTMNLKN